MIRPDVFRPFRVSSSLRPDGLLFSREGATANFGGVFRNRMNNFD